MSHEREYYDALKKIARGYQPSDWYRDHAQLKYGLSAEEALEMAYDNIQAEAESAIKGKQRPKE